VPMASKAGASPSSLVATIRASAMPSMPSISIDWGSWRVGGLRPTAPCMLSSTLFGASRYGPCSTRVHGPLAGLPVRGHFSWGPTLPTPRGLRSVRSVAKRFATLVPPLIRLYSGSQKPATPEQLWLRFAVGQPVRALRTQFRAWC
jgi:hypothetical protein